MTATNVFSKKETGYITLSFTNEYGDAVVPDSATYTLYDESSGDIINGRNQTAISGLASTIDLKLVSDDNIIVDTDSVNEAHILLVEWVYETTKKGKDIYKFFVANLAKVS